MENKENNKKYPKGIIIIHWLTVILLALVFYRGMSLEDIEFNEANISIYRAHAIPGMLILIITLVRIFIKRKNKENLPKEIEYYSFIHKAVVETVNKFIYVLLILTPLMGFIMIYQTGALSYDFGGPFPKGAELNEILEILHKVFVFSLLSLVVIHVLGVIIYKFKKGENLLRRMCHLLK